MAIERAIFTSTADSTTITFEYFFVSNFFKNVGEVTGHISFPFFVREYKATQSAAVNRIHNFRIKRLQVLELTYMYW